MEVSNSTGQNTNCKVTGTGGGTQSSRGGRGGRGERKLGSAWEGKLAPNTYVSIEPQPGVDSWRIEFLSGEAVVARKTVRDPHALVVLTQRDNGEHKILVCKRHAEAASQAA
ncbi:MAG TPA: hypothetical protein VF756_19825 [Thermoanaerobaculia bacterium]